MSKDGDHQIKLKLAEKVSNKSDGSAVRVDANPPREVVIDLSVRIKQAHGAAILRDLHSKGLLRKKT
jgi:hypothetical protein